MGFPCAGRSNEGQVPVGVDGMQRGQDPQPLYILALEQGEVEILKGFGCFGWKTAHFQQCVNGSLLLFSAQIGENRPHCFHPGL